MELIDKIVKIDTIDSTQKLAKEIVKEKPKNNILILSNSQTDGYGRRGNFWSSEVGGIYLTLITKMNFTDKIVEKLSLRTAQAIKMAIEEYGIKAKIKYPNDVQVKVGKKYKKIAGILIEVIQDAGNETYILFGIGINTNNKIPKDLKEIAVSLKDVLGKEIDNEEFLKLFFNFFWAEIKTIQCSTI